jgi:lipopolysaccharide export LptBFGC system permease protein LptF
MAREWITWFSGCLFFLVSTIFLFSTVENLEQVFPRGMDHWWEDFGYWLLSYLPWLLPICCLGASLFTLSFVKKRGEWTGLLANGISPWQSFFVIILLGIGVGGASDWMMNHLGDRSMDMSGLTKTSLKMQSGNDRLWYFRSFDPATCTGHDLQLFTYGKGGEDLFRIRAERAVWDLQHGWSFHKGRFLGFYSSLGLPVIDEKGTTIIWESLPNLGNEDGIYQTKSPGINRSFQRIEGLGLMDDPLPYLWLQKRPKEMSSLEIDRLLDYLPNPQTSEINPYRLRKAQLWWNGPACMVALLVGLGLGCCRRFSTPAQLAGVALLGAMCFYLVRTLSESLGEQQILSPFVSASLPYILVMMATVLLIRIKI